MKKKFYAKKMKPSALPEASTTDSTNQALPGSPAVANADNTKHTEKPSDGSVTSSPVIPSTVSTSTLSTSSVSTAVSTGVRAPPMGRPVSNSTPLPKVDVLMKSSLKAFQLADNQNNPINNNNNSNSNNNHNNNNNTNNSNGVPKPSLTAPSLGSLGSNGDVLNQQAAGAWSKESSMNSEANLTPLSSGHHYDVGNYTRPSGFEIGESSVGEIKMESRDPSPVYHQMERPVQPLSDAGMYSNPPSMAPEYTDMHGHPTNGPQNGMPSDQVMSDSSDIIRAYDMGSYEHEDSDEEEDEPIQNYGHIRAWDQENNSYMDYDWSEEHHATANPVYVKMSSESSNSYSSSTDSGGGQRAKRSSVKLGGNGKMAGSGMTTRRRRKRVQTPVQRSAANMRERRRMCHLNVAFDHLKNHLPHVKDKKKLSRIQTLKAAIYYIHLLQDSLNPALK